MSSPTSELNIHTGSEIVRAGAGAGKTTELTTQVLQRAEAYYSAHKKMPRMVVTTFTRKATQELRERLMVRALQSGKPELIEFVNSRAHLYVSTIHGVLELYLKRFGAPIAIDPNFFVLNRTDAAKLARKALREVLFQNLSYQELLEVFDFKKLAYLSRQYHELKLRSSKVKAHDLDSLYSALFELLNELTSQIDEVVENILSEASGPKGEEWSNFAKSIWKVSDLLKKAEVKTWEKSRLTAIQMLESIQKPRANSRNPSVSEESSEAAKKTLEELDEFIQVNSSESLEFFAQTFTKFEELATEFSQKFQKLKKDQGSIEISDMELLAGECIRKQPESAVAFSKEWDHWLIDEYQDTSPFQVELLSDLVGDRPVFIVGDPQQSIYLFRGARSEVFGKKEEEIKSKLGQLRLLDKNYRSRRELLLFFNDFFGGFGSKFMPMLSFQEKPHAKSEPVAKFFVAPKPDKKASPDAPDEELVALVNHVLGRLLNGEKPESICVLARTRATLVKIADMLDAVGVPVHLHASGGFYERREIQDALSLLKFLVNPHDDHNLMVLLRSPWFRVSDDALVHAIRNAEESYWSILSKIENLEFEAIARLKRFLQSRNDCGVSSSFREALIESGFVDAARIHDSSGRRESNLWKLVSRLASEETKPGFNPLQFILNTQAELRDFEGSEEGDAVTAVEPNRVNLMTIHASKGLAFDHVILPRLHERPRLSTHVDFLYDENINRWSMRVPVGPDHKMSGSVAEKLFLNHYRQQELLEHQRVLYVALTRARHSVYMSWTEPAQKNSWLEQIRFDLTEGTHNAEEYSYIVTREIPPATPLSKLGSSGLAPRSLWKNVRVDTGVQQSSVTEILEENSKYKFQSAKGKFLNKIWSSSHGTAVHKLMEMMKYRSEVQIAKLIEQWFPDRPEQVAKAINWMGELNEPNVMQLIKDGEVEWSFAFKVNDRLIEGQVDLWGRDHKQVWIVDYKTGNSDQFEKAFSQMELYSLALRRAGLVEPSETIMLAAIYPFSEKLFTRAAASEQKLINEYFSS